MEALENDAEIEAPSGRGDHWTEFHARFRRDFAEKPSNFREQSGLGALHPAIMALKYFKENVQRFRC